MGPCGGEITLAKPPRVCGVNTIFGLNSTIGGNEDEKD